MVIPTGPSVSGDILMRAYGEAVSKHLGQPIVVENKPGGATFDSPYGLVGPKGMDPAIVKKLHDAFKKAYDDPKVIEAYDKFDFVRRYMNTEDYQVCAPAGCGRAGINGKAWLWQKGLK